MKKWESKEIDIGTIKPMKKIIVTFKCLESLDNAVSVTSSCGCSSGHISGDNVIVSFKPGNVPTHLLRSGIKSSIIRKTLRVHYKDEQEDILQFKGILTE